MLVCVVRAVITQGVRLGKLFMLVFWTRVALDDGHHERHIQHFQHT